MLYMKSMLIEKLPPSPHSRKIAPNKFPPGFGVGLGSGAIFRWSRGGGGGGGGGGGVIFQGEIF